MRTILAIAMCMILIFGNSCVLANTYTRCSCGHVFEPETYSVSGCLAGAMAGGYFGARIGIALGPWGAIAGTVPGIILGGVIGGLGGSKFTKCPVCSKVFPY